MNSRLSLVVLWLGAVLFGGEPFSLAAEQAAVPEPVRYHSNPEHLWNRLHRALFIRTDSSGRKFGNEEFEPLLFSNSQYLLEGRSHQQAIEVLDEFLAKRGERLVEDPLKRALLQHDLWTVFDWMAYPYRQEKSLPARRQFWPCLAAAIIRLGLEDRQLRSLPDNYADSIRSHVFASRYDPDHPDRPFLPPDLFEANGPWVCLSELSEPIAQAHVGSASGRSVLLVFMRLPEGREATLAYLKKLNLFTKPWILKENPTGWVHPNGEPVRLDLVERNPELPQFPVDTQVALVRQMVLINARGDLVPTTLTESVQIRVYIKIPPGITKDFPERFKHQSAYEFRLRPGSLLAGTNGGLHAVGKDEKTFEHFMTHDLDPFERESLAEAKAEPDRPRLRSCLQCHVGNGIHSVQSYRVFGARTQPINLYPSTAADERRIVIHWKEKQFDWGLLKGFMEATLAHGAPAP